MEPDKVLLAIIIFIVGLPLAIIIGAAGLGPILELVIMLVLTGGFFIALFGIPIAIIYFVIKFLANAIDDLGTYTYDGSKDKK